MGLIIMNQSCPQAGKHHIKIIVQGTVRPQAVIVSRVLLGLCHDLSGSSRSSMHVALIDFPVVDRLHHCLGRHGDDLRIGFAFHFRDDERINRLPVRYRYDNSYFSTPWQGIPAKGYAALFSALTESPLIEVRTGTDFFAVRSSIPETAIVIYTGMIDRLFDNRFGILEWRSLRFEWKTLPVRDYQGTSVMNYGDREVPFTRIHEFKHYHPEWKDSWEAEKTVICREYPATWSPGGEAYYPLGDEKNQNLLSRYMAEAEQMPNLFVAGRLGSYQYLDMDGAIAQALACFDGADEG